MQVLGESERVDAVDEVDEGDDLLDLVPLEVADHVPADLVGDVGVVAVDGMSEGVSPLKELVHLGGPLLSCWARDSPRSRWPSSSRARIWSGMAYLVTATRMQSSGLRPERAQASPSAG